MPSPLASLLWGAGVLPALAMLVAGTGLSTVGMIAAAAGYLPPLAGVVLQEPGADDLAGLRRDL